MSTDAVSAEAVRAAIEPAVTAHDVDLETVSLAAAGRRTVITVVIDADGGVDLDRVADISRSISDLLDAQPEIFDGPFVLEVTSPGVDRPLSTAKHWHRAKSRRVQISLIGGGELLGRIIDSDEHSATIEPADGEAVVVPFTDVRTAIVQVEFTARDEEK